MCVRSVRVRCNWNWNMERWRWWHFIHVVFKWLSWVSASMWIEFQRGKLDSGLQLRPSFFSFFFIKFIRWMVEICEKVRDKFLIYNLIFRRLKWRYTSNLLIFERLFEKLFNYNLDDCHFNILANFKKLLEKKILLKD